MTKLLHLIETRRLLAGGLLLCLAAVSSAATLGSNLRSAVLGQPLDLSMRLMLDAGEDPSALCLGADVFYVDKPLDKSLVQLSTEKSGTAQDWLVRVRSAVPVEGSVVTVHLRAGCVQKSTRRYVVLAVARPKANAAASDKELVGAGAAGAASDERVRALEIELRQMREEMMKNQTLLAERGSRFEKAESERYSKALVYGLAALLAAALIALFYHSYKRSIAPAATNGGTLKTGFGPATGFGAPNDFGMPPELSSQAPAMHAPSGDDAAFSESLLQGLKRASRNPPPESIPPLALRDRPRFSVSVPFVPRTVKVPELFDLQQQVDFFTSLGKQEQAISLLRRHLVDNVKTSALVYLDLLDLYHQTGNEADFEDLRDDFNRVFKMHVAPFASFGGVAAGTSAYEAVLLRVQAVWPTRKVFHVLEDALFREPGNPVEVLTLEEYRELLLIYAVGREIIDTESGTSGAGDDTQSPDLAMQPRSSPRLGLDIDLNQFSVNDERSASPSLRDVRPGTHAGDRESRSALNRSDIQPATADLPHTARRKESERAGTSSASAPLDMPRNSQQTTSLDSLVDFDDYDTGFRENDLDRPSRI